jgi:hypothetical protein
MPVVGVGNDVKGLLHMFWHGSIKRIYVKKTFFKLKRLKIYGGVGRWLPSGWNPFSSAR